MEVVVDYARLPRSLQCRPWRVRAIVHSGDGKLSFESPFVVKGRHGRIVVSLPWFGHPPYRLDISSENLFGRRGPSVEIPLRCPGTGDRPKGCLAGLTGVSTPTPKLALRGVSLPSLRASLDYLLGPQRKTPVLRAAPRAFSCSSLRRCEVTYVDEAFPASPFKIRYRIVGQQIRGCWMGVQQSIIGEKPYEDAGGGAPIVAACVSWVR